MQTLENRSSGSSFGDLLGKLQYEEQNKKDYRVPVSQMRMNDTGEIQLGADKSFQLNDWSSSQLASYCQIPKRYFDRISGEKPELLSNMVNHDLLKKEKEGHANQESATRLVRTVGPKIRALVSNRFQPLDALPLVKVMAPILDNGGFQPLPRGNELTEKRVYIKAVTPRIESEVKKGDIVQFGVMISTSDVGAGSLKIETFANRLVCLNGMVMGEGIKRRHVGAKHEAVSIEELSPELIMETQQVYMKQVGEMLQKAMKPENFEREVNKMRQAAGMEVKSLKSLEKIVDVTSQQFKIADDDIIQQVLTHFESGNQGAGFTQWGLANSFTAAAKFTEDYEKSIELERAGGMILELNPNQWERLTTVH